MSKTIPSKVRIGPHKYEVLEDQAACEAAEVTGAYLRDSLQIIVDKASATGIRQETLLHESLHGIWQTAGLQFDYDDSGNDSPGERIISRLSPVLLQFLRENPEVVKWLTNS